MLPGAIWIVTDMKMFFFQIWDEFIWVTPTVGCLNQKGPLCWEQRNHSKNYPNYTQYLGWIPKDHCSHIITLQTTDWFATYWPYSPGTHWPAPNNSHWLWGTDLWPWLPPGWIGRWTLRFPWSQRSWVRDIPGPANLPVLQHQWTRSVFIGMTTWPLFLCYLLV